MIFCKLLEYIPVDQCIIKYKEENDINVALYVNMQTHI